MTQKTAETMKTISSRKTGELLVSLSLSLSLSLSQEIWGNFGKCGKNWPSVLAAVSQGLRGSGRGFQGRGGRL